MNLKKWSAVALVVVLVAGGGWWWAQRGDTQALGYRTAKLERGGLQATVSASGAVNPVTQVSVGTQVSGQIRDLYVDYNAEVKAGQLIAQIDPETFEYRVRSAQADLDAARANVLTAQANAAASRANVSRAQTDLAEAQRGHDRNLNLVAQGFISQSEADRTRALVASAGEALKSAQAQLGVSEAQIKSAQATVAQRDAVLAQAGVDLGRTRIKSPVDGIVIKRAVERGQTVAASLQSPELFVIAQNLSDMQVDASIDEADVGRIRTGLKASFTVDAFPGQTFEGEVRQVRKAAQNVANVVTYIAVVRFSNAAGRLLPGMTANVRILTDSRENVLKVPNAALRVRLPGVEPGGATPPADGSPAPAVAAGPGGRNPMGEFRERLIKQLRLTEDQIGKVDGIFAGARPQFAALRELAEKERPKARERIMIDVRARISDLLTPEQKPIYATMVAELAGRQSTRGRLFVLGADGKPQAFDVRLGISDGSMTELLLGPDSPATAALKAGTEVVVGTQAAAPRTASGPRFSF
ncbi:efflux RND transporter periplasmic adaptor subunit [Hydrogenophaga sp. OTU3427]|uniref:efflux RND transporter periplasmic adaptor subunit n=1 Tax=Hydrogenophaga sp. OTU3427 TaxID=3043856 RepID=UPI00313F1350